MQAMRKDNYRLTARLSAISAASPIAAPLTFLRCRRRRGEPREPTYRFARVMIGERTIVCCIIKDLSKSGARITMEGAHDLPETLVLAVDQSGRRYRARVAWRREQEAGLSFVGEVGPVRRTTE